MPSGSNRKMSESKGVASTFRINRIDRYERRTLNTRARARVRYDHRIVKREFVASLNDVYASP